MSEVDAIKAVSDAMQGLEKDEQIRVLAWAQAKFAGAAAMTPATTPAGAAVFSPAPSNAASAKTVKSKGGKKVKSIISMDKSLNLSPSGKASAAQFAAEKGPSNVKEKCVVAVHYLRDVIELEKISVQAVFTFFKTVQWVVPADLKNTLQQAGTEGWLDTADSEEIKLTSMGENLVEHDLPAKPKS